MLTTRCPHCGTAFRVKPEQLRLRGGRVRCGHCQAPFSALESLIDTPSAAQPAPAVPDQTPPPGVGASEQTTAQAAETRAAVEDKPFELAAPVALPEPPIENRSPFSPSWTPPPQRGVFLSPEGEIAPPMPELDPGAPAIPKLDFDFDDLERKAADPAVKLMLLCNPHNPAGRVWTPAELHRIGELCLRHDVVVVADEIHCELVMPGFRYTPFASLCEEFERRSVTCTSPSKAFNLAGLQVANIFAADAALRARIGHSLQINETGEIGPFAIEALIAAYDEGAEWLDALNEYLHGNYRFSREYFDRNLPQYPVLPLEGTYLVWVDCRASGLTSDELETKLLEEAKLRINPGAIYGEAGRDFIRLNIACPRKLLAEGLDRLRKVLKR